MTDNEIIKCLRHCRAGDCENCKALNVCDATFSFHKEALDLINRQKAKIERLTVLVDEMSGFLPSLALVQRALEKQIPKKPTPNEKDNIRFSLCYSCPECGRTFSGTGIADYCYHCGQALNWSEEK